MQATVASVKEAKGLPRFIDGRRIRSWRRQGVTVPHVGEEAHGREITELLHVPGREPIVVYMTENTEGACTVSVWKTWKRTGEELYTDWRFFFRNKGERKRRR